MAQLHIPPYDATKFSHNVFDKRMIAEMSDLQIPPGAKWSPLYDDACDIGIALRNPNNGHTTTWYWSKDERDGEGDLVAVEFKPTYESVRKYPQLND